MMPASCSWQPAKKEKVGRLAGEGWEMNTFGEPTRATVATTTTLYDAQYARDKVGRITTKTESVLGATDDYEYKYDGAGRLVEVRKNDVTISVYAYDSNGNRTGRWSSDTGTTTTAEYDNQDRLLRYGTTNYGYTSNGELKTKKEDGASTVTYEYDAAGNLLQVNLADGREIEYLIDTTDHRVGKKVDGVVERKFLYAGGLSPIAELNTSNTLVSLFVYATRLNVPDYMLRKEGSLYVPYRLISDHLGSPRLVVKVETGEVVQRLDYDEFGRVLTDTNPGFQPFGFAGGLHDSDTGLVRFGARDYDPEVGRFTTKDPIGLLGGLNVYGYVLNEPVNLLDPTGLGPKLLPHRLFNSYLDYLGGEGTAEEFWQFRENFQGGFFIESRFNHGLATAGLSWYSAIQVNSFGFVPIPVISPNAGLYFVGAFEGITPGMTLSLQVGAAFSPSPNTLWGNADDPSHGAQLSFQSPTPWGLTAGVSGTGFGHEDFISANAGTYIGYKALPITINRSYYVPLWVPGLN